MLHFETALQTAQNETAPDKEALAKTIYVTSADEAGQTSVFAIPVEDIMSVASAAVADESANPNKAYIVVKEQAIDWSDKFNAPKYRSIHAQETIAEIENILRGEPSGLMLEAWQEALASIYNEEHKIVATEIAHAFTLKKPRLEASTPEADHKPAHTHRKGGLFRRLTQSWTKTAHAEPREPIAPALQDRLEALQADRETQDQKIRAYFNDHTSDEALKAEIEEIAALFRTLMQEKQQQNKLPYIVEKQGEVRDIRVHHENVALEPSP